jgi:hypothetical protein
MTGGSRLITLNAREKLDDRLTHLVQVGSELLEHLSSNTLPLTDEAEQDVFGTDVVVAELKCLTERQFENLLGAGGERDVAARSLRSLPDDFDNLAANRLKADSHALEGASGDTFTFVNQAEEDVLRADVVVVEESRLFLSEDDDPAGPIGEPFEQGNTS